MLAGKNESGKTNVLNAILTAYNDDFEEDDVPVSVQDADPTVKLSFKFNSKYIEEKLGVSLEEQKNYTMVLTRSKSTVDIYEGSIIYYFVDIFTEQDRAKYSISKNNKVTSSYNFYNKVIDKEIEKEDLEQETINNIKK